MSNHHDIDPARAATITQRIGETFDFMRAAIDDPRILGEIPTGSTLRFRKVELPHGAIQITVFRPQGEAAGWYPHTPGAPAAAAGPHPWRNQIETRSAGGSTVWKAIALELGDGSWETADAALDALEAALRRSPAGSGRMSRRAIGG